MEFDNFNIYIDRKVDPDNDYKIINPDLGKYGMMVPTDNTPFTEEEESLCATALEECPVEAIGDDG